MTSIPLINITRSVYVESVHRGSIVVVQDNKIIFSLGNPDQIVPLRSTAKPFILLPLLQNDGINKYNLNNSELTIMASSHNGEKTHRDTVIGILNKAHLSIKDLHCGTHMPFFEWLIFEYAKETDINVKQLYHNCSGKHAAMLLMCKLFNYSIVNYWSYDHPLQHKILEALKLYFEISKSEELAIGLDGCGVLTYFLSISKLAFAYQKLCQSKELNQINKAILQQPFMIAGTDRLDTLIIEKCGYIAKSGSDGLFCVSIPNQNIGIALKIESGCDEAAESAIVGLLEKLGLISSDKLLYFSNYINTPIYTTTNVLSGRYESCF